MAARHWLIEALRHDVRDEKGELLPQLQARVGGARDRLEDLARRGPRLRGTATALSRVAARAAGAVEQLPPLRRGEHASTSRR